MRSWLAVGLLAVGLASCAVDGDTREVVDHPDDEGRVAASPSSPRRIVSLVPVATEILYALGAQDRLVGRSRWDDFPPEVRQVPDVGDAIRPSVERVVMREPDLVLLVGGSDNAQAVRELERLDVPIMVLRFDTLEDLERDIGRLGAVVGRTEEAAALVEKIRSELDAVRSSVAGRDTPSVYYDVGYPPAFTVGRGSYLDSLIAVAGGRNVFHDVQDPSFQVGLEAILARDPDILIHPVGSGGMGSSPPSERPGWAALRAVRDGEVRTVPADLVHRLGPRLGAAARALAEAVHPELYTEAGE